MIDPKKASKLIRQHFEKLTTEQFVINLHRSCPEVFEDNQQSQNSSNLISANNFSPLRAIPRRKNID